MLLDLKQHSYLHCTVIFNNREFCVNPVPLLFVNVCPLSLYDAVWKAKARDIMPQSSQECPGFCGADENKVT